MSALRRLLRNRSGTAAAEMALIFPVVGFITLNVVDFATFAYSKMQVDLAAEQAVGFARATCIKEENEAVLEAGTCGTTYSAEIASAAQQTTLGTDVTLVGTPGEKYYCANDSGELKETDEAPPTPPPADCSGIVTGSTTAPGSYISATISYTYTPIFPGVSIASYLSTAITSTAWMRLQ